MITVLLELSCCPLATRAPANPTSATNHNRIRRQRERTQGSRQLAFVNDFEQTRAELPERKAVGSKTIVRTRPEICVNLKVNEPSPFAFYRNLVKSSCWDEDDLVVEPQLARVEYGEEVPEPGIPLDSVRGQLEPQQEVGLPTISASLQFERDLDLDADRRQGLQVAAYLRITALVIGRRNVYL